MAARPDRQRDKGTKGTNRQVREGTRGGLPRETGPRDGEGGRESRRTQAGAASGGADRDEEGERKEKEGVHPTLKDCGAAELPATARPVAKGGLRVA